MARPLVISHRTHMGTQPENSLEGIRAALEEDVDGIEIDVRASADGVPLLLHDATLGRTHGDPRALGDLRAAEARALGVPALEEALATVAGRATLYVEVKERGLGVAVASAVRAANATPWCWVWAFDPGVCRELRGLLPEVPVALNANALSGVRFGYSAPLEVGVREELAAVSLDHRVLTSELVERGHSLGLRVFTWTVDEPADIRRAIDAGADGVCGNYPRRIRAALEA
jgi:glycerophosphoryl diester phosphodiesterase